MNAPKKSIVKIQKSEDDKGPDRAQDEPRDDKGNRDRLKIVHREKTDDDPIEPENKSDDDLNDALVFHAKRLAYFGRDFNAFHKDFEYHSFFVTNLRKIVTNNSNYV